MILGIDPGIRHCGLAIVSDCGEVHETHGVSTNSQLPLVERVAMIVARGYDRIKTQTTLIDHVIIEHMTIYPHEKTNKQDLISVALVEGALIEWWYGNLGLPVTLVEPRTWKKQVPKKIHHARIRKKITCDEDKFSFDFVNEHQKDAIGLALYYLEKNRK